MNISKKSEYALKALTELAINYGKGIDITLISHIAGKEKIPQRYLEQILLRLKNAGILTSKRGIGGGYALSRPPENISLLEIMSVVDGQLSLSQSLKEAESTLIEDEVSLALNDAMREVGNGIRNIINGISLKDIAKKATDLIEQRKGSLNYVI